jgi:predicted adenine nucleotide alpha hydrolase (AANH) superfamily ATPase
MKVVLHICCGVCAAGAAERLMAEGHQVIGLFDNPNIHPEEEFRRRLKAAARVAEEMSFALEKGCYDPAQWFQRADAFADEPEGGRRCEVCFRLRLERAHRFMLERGAEAFTTTLTVGPRKSAEVVNRIGHEIGGDSFLSRDFKKKDGFRRASELARRWGLYRQSYCGCIYSMRSG